MRHVRDNPSDAYREAQSTFAWNIPARFNIGVDVCDKWAEVDAHRTAIIEYTSEGLRRTSFGELRRQSNRLAHLLVRRGVRSGDRVAVLAPQRVETAIAHIAIYKVGAIAVPLFSLFGSDALRHRLADSGARVAIVDRAGFEKLEGLRGELPALEAVLVFENANRTRALDRMLAGESDEFNPVDTAADDPAMIIYTSGTTGSSKGALHGHRVLFGHLPGVEMSHGGFPQPGDCMWTPADWAWIGGLLDVLLPSLHHGVPVVAHRFDKFDAAAAFQLMADCNVRNVFLPPTALKMMRAEPDPQLRWRHRLRSVASGGESLGAELMSWGRACLGVSINEFYGQTECNMVISSCDAWFPSRAGAMGKAVLGHKVSIIDQEGRVLAPGEEGDIAVLTPDPVSFLGYWGNSEATKSKFRGAWLITGDRGTMDAEGYVQFVGRIDDVITSAGYRIGPGEIEDCLLRHSAVRSVGVVGMPDAARTEVVTAFVVLASGVQASASLIGELQQHVRIRLGGHQYPRQIRFVDELPLTITGKIIRRELRRWAIDTLSE